MIAVTNKDRYDLIIGAIDWLLANPDRHAVGVMSKTKGGFTCFPTEPAAHCFCLIGRTLHDAHVKGMIEGLDRPSDNFEPLYSAMNVFGSPIDMHSTTLYRANDHEYPSMRRTRLEALRAKLEQAREENV